MGEQLECVHAQIQQMYRESVPAASKPNQNFSPPSPPPPPPPSPPSSSHHSFKISKTATEQVILIVSTVPPSKSSVSLTSPPRTGAQDLEEISPQQPFWSLVYKLNHLRNTPAPSQYWAIEGRDTMDGGPERTDRRCRNHSPCQQSHDSLPVDVIASEISVSCPTLGRHGRHYRHSAANAP